MKIVCGEIEAEVSVTADRSFSSLKDNIQGRSLKTEGVKPDLGKEEEVQVDEIQICGSLFTVPHKFTKSVDKTRAMVTGHFSATVGLFAQVRQFSFCIEIRSVRVVARNIERCPIFRCVITDFGNGSQISQASCSDAELYPKQGSEIFLYS